MVDCGMWDNEVHQTDKMSLALSAIVFKNCVKMINKIHIIVLLATFYGTRSIKKCSKWACIETSVTHQILILIQIYTICQFLIRSQELYYLTMIPMEFL